MSTKKKRRFLQLILFESYDSNTETTKRKFMKANVHYSYRPDLLCFEVYHYQKTLERWGLDLNTYCTITYGFETYQIVRLHEFKRSVGLVAYRGGTKGKNVVDLYLHNHK